MSNNDETRGNDPTPVDRRSGGIYFGNDATVEGNVIGRDQYNLGATPDISEGHFSTEELLELLSELKSCIKQAPIDEDDKDIATGQIATAIREAKQTSQENLTEKKNKIGKYLEDTKTILDRVKDIGEIGEKAFPILNKLAKILGLGFSLL